MYKANCSACSVAESVSEKGKARPRQKNRDFSKINARFSLCVQFPDPPETAFSPSNSW